MSMISVKFLLISALLASLLLSVHCVNAFNVNFRGDSFSRALSLQNRQHLKDTSSNHGKVMYHNYQDFFMVGVRRGLIARADYEGDYSTDGVANQNTNTPPVPPTK